ncbi:CPBP family intramembrane glutamic endopeptidase [Propionibacteriaceae bacterium Y2011]|uniref:CPBP family intramembrane glutamic endopeptidase n=1 Tax=Microlunatus sp. Y2014 TaxID=3418488 RepID=UPI003B4D846A
MINTQPETTTRRPDRAAVEPALRPPPDARLPAPVRILIGFVGFVAVLFAAGLGVPLGLTTLLPTIPLVVVNLIGMATFCGGSVALAAGLARLDGRHRHPELGSPLAQLGLRWSRREAAMLGLTFVVLVLATVALAGISRLTGLAAPVPEVASIPIAAVLGGLAYAFLPSFVMQGFPEELIFRGYVMNAAKVRVGVALAISSLLFGSLHLLSQSPAEGVVEKFVLYPLQAVALGFVCGAAQIGTGSLWAAVGVHGGMHIGTRIAGLLAAPHDYGLQLILVTGLYVVLGVLFLVLRSRLAPRSSPQVPGGAGGSN